MKYALSASLFTLSIIAAAPVQAQQITGMPGSPSATTTIPGNQLPPPDPKFGGVTRPAIEAMVGAARGAAEGRA